MKRYLVHIKGVIHNFEGSFNLELLLTSVVLNINVVKDIFKRIK